jgi:hypothetical protein
MATVGNNPKVSAAVSVAAGGTYNCPATSSYAIVNVTWDGSGSQSFTVAGRTHSASLAGLLPTPVYVGPGQALVMGANTVATGVQFTNS